MTPTNPTIDKLAEILEKLQAIEPGTSYYTQKGSETITSTPVKEAKQAIIAWALEAVPEKKHIGVGISTIHEYQYMGYNKAIDDFRAKLTGGTE